MKIFVNLKKKHTQNPLCMRSSPRDLMVGTDPSWDQTNYSRADTRKLERTPPGKTAASTTTNQQFYNKYEAYRSGQMLITNTLNATDLSSIASIFLDECILIEHFTHTSLHYFYFLNTGTNCT